MKVEQKLTSLKTSHASDFPKIEYNLDANDNAPPNKNTSQNKNSNSNSNSEDVYENIAVLPVPKLADKPTRKISTLIEEVIEKNIEVELTREGYKISGFYGMPSILLQDSQEEGILIATDHKGKKHAVKDFFDLISLNNLVWRGFYKQDDKYRRPDTRWFVHLYESGQIELVPGKNKD